MIRGIIFHQGEADSGSATWVDAVKALVENLRTDLEIGEVPFVAGELLYKEKGGCCGEFHNPLVNRLPDKISNTYVVSSSEFDGQDEAHFTTASRRIQGTRYGEIMVEALR